MLVSHKNYLDITSQKFCEVNALAEILSVTFQTKCEKSFCLSTFYRVGTLGIENFKEFHKHISAHIPNKKTARNIPIGDFNLPEIYWPDSTTYVTYRKNT